MPNDNYLGWDCPFDESGMKAGPTMQKLTKMLMKRAQIKPLKRMSKIVKLPRKKKVHYY